MSNILFPLFFSLSLPSDNKKFNCILQIFTSLNFYIFSSYSYWIISVNLSSGFWFFLLLSQIWYGNSSKFWFQLLFLKLQFLFCYHKTSIFVLIFLIQWHVIIILSFNSLEMTSFSSLNIFLIAHLDLLYSKSSICAL